MKYIIANWKMNKTFSESVSFINEFSKKVGSFGSTEVAICPTFLGIPAIKKSCEECGIKLGAQNCYFEDKGAFTGEISAEMLKDLGVEYVILGHSERREYFKETNSVINKKIKSALKNKLRAIFCVGETQEQRDNGQEFSVVKSQLVECLDGIDSEMLKNVIIAYEPVWAIGTGKVVTEADACKMASEIKKFISSKFEIIEGCAVLYGGSMNSSNAEKFLKLPEIDGGLIGGASLDVDEFLKITEISESLSRRF